MGHGVTESRPQKVPGEETISFNIDSTFAPTQRNVLTDSNFSKSEYFQYFLILIIRFDVVD